MKHIACGSGLVGSHSLFIVDNHYLNHTGDTSDTPNDTDNCSLFGCGLGKALGLSTIQPVLTPTKIPIRDYIPAVDQQTLLEVDDSENIKSVAAGDCFTIVLTHTGRVYSFGLYTHGRLGLGNIPLMQKSGRGRLSTFTTTTNTNNSLMGNVIANDRNTNSSSAGNSKLMKYQLSAKCIASITNAVDVQCGEAHTLVLLKSGHVLAFGKNSLGQLGE